MPKYSVQIVPWKNALPYCSVLPFSNTKNATVILWFTYACCPKHWQDRFGKKNLKHVTAQGGKNGKNLAGHRLKPDRNPSKSLSGIFYFKSVLFFVFFKNFFTFFLKKIKRWRTEMLIFHFCLMPLCKGKFVCLFLHYILGTQPTAHNEITKTLDLSRILTGEEGLKEKRMNQNDTNSSHSGQ